MLPCFTLHFAVSLTLAAGTAFQGSPSACGGDQLMPVRSCGELPSCPNYSSGCNSSGCNSCELPECELPECGVCGQNQCWDCSGEEGIDIDSLTAAAQSKKLYEASLARIVFVLPEDAGVSLLDQKMTTLGPKRSFVVAVPDQAKDYKYEMKVDVVRNGKKYFKRLKINDLRAGMILTVAVEAPPVPEGEPAQIALALKIDAPGGKPPEADSDAEVKTDGDAQ